MNIIKSNNRSLWDLNPRSFDYYHPSLKMELTVERINQLC